jgi:hypothetical protein
VLQRLRKPGLAQIVRALTDGRLRLSHEALDAFAHEPQVVEFVRSLLVRHGVLPRRSRELDAFQQWIGGKLAHVEDEEHRRIVRLFAEWKHLRRFRSGARSSGPARGEVLAARQSVTVAIEFLAW